MVLFQILFIIFSLVAVASILKKKKEVGLSSRGVFLWVLFWVMADVVVIWPSITTRVANQLGIGRGTDLVFYLSAVLVFYILFRLHVKMESINRDVTEIVRRRALDKVKDEE